MIVTKEFIDSNIDLQRIEPLLVHEYGEKAKEIYHQLQEQRAELRGIFVVHETSDSQSCIGLAVGTADYQNNLHLSSGIQICDSEHLQNVELIRKLIEYARGKFQSIVDTCSPYEGVHKQLLQVYGTLDFRIDADPAFAAAEKARQYGIERLPEESTPQSIRDTYFELDLTNTNS